MKRKNGLKCNLIFISLLQFYLVSRFPLNRFLRGQLVVKRGVSPLPCSILYTILAYVLSVPKPLFCLQQILS